MRLRVVPLNRPSRRLETVVDWWEWLANARNPRDRPLARRRDSFGLGHGRPGSQRLAVFVNRADVSLNRRFLLLRNRAAFVTLRRVRRALLSWAFQPLDCAVRVLNALLHVVFWVFSRAELALNLWRFRANLRRASAEFSRLSSRLRRALFDSRRARLVRRVVLLWHLRPWLRRSAMALDSLQLLLRALVDLFRALVDALSLRFRHRRRLSL